MIISEIKWDVDMDEVYETLDNMAAQQASESLEMPERIYANMTTEERHDYAYDRFHHCPALLDEFLGLPDKIEVPEDVLAECLNTDSLREYLESYLGDLCESNRLYESEIEDYLDQFDEWAETASIGDSFICEDNTYTLDVDYELLSDWLSDHYGFCHEGFTLS